MIFFRVKDSSVMNIINLLFFLFVGRIITESGASAGGTLCVPLARTSSIKQFEHSFLDRHFPSYEKVFLLRGVQTGSAVLPASYPIRTGGFILEGKTVEA
jgi:hypothetical protein